MRPWYKHTEQDDYVVRRPMLITPFSGIWGYGATATLWLIGINAVIWLIMVISGVSTNLLPINDFWYQNFAMTPELVYKGRVWQVVTSMFFHDGINILHLVMNLYFLWMFGPRVERTFSSGKFIIFYLVCGIAGSILSLLMRSLMGDMNTPSLGASAAIFGVLVAYAFLFYNETVLLFFAIPLKVWKVVVGFIVLETLFILIGYLQDVDHFAHLGGAIAAAIWMLVEMRKGEYNAPHGWLHDRGGMPLIGGGQNSSGSGFRVIISRPGQKQDDHPEGTDNEPPPDWFKIE